MALKKISINVKSAASAAEAKLEGTQYFGPIPPRDVYRCLLKRLKNDESKNGSMMLKYTCVIDEIGDRAKYNGYPIFGQQVVSDAGQAFVNNLLDGLSGGKAEVRRAFWSGQVFENESHIVVKIGTMKIDPAGMVVWVGGKEESYQGARQLKIASFLLPTEAEAAQSSYVASGPQESTLEDDEDEPDVEEDDELDEEDEDIEDEDEEGEDDNSERRTELEGLARKELVAVAREAGIKATKGIEDSVLIEKILELEDVPF